MANNVPGRKPRNAIMKRYDAIFLDLYGTILHFDYSILPEVPHGGEKLRTTSLKVHREVARRFGFEVSFERFLAEMLESRRALVEMRGPEEREFPSLVRFQWICRRLGLQAEGAAELMVELHMEQMFQMMFLPEANRRVLEGLEAFPKILASNFDHAPTVRRALGKFDLETRFDHVFISDEVGWRKPGVNFFDAILKGSGFDPRRCLFVGDDPVADLLGASRMGFDVAWLAPADAAPPPVKPTWRLGSLEELPLIVR